MDEKIWNVEYEEPIINGRVITYEFYCELMECRTGNQILEDAAEINQIITKIRQIRQNNGIKKHIPFPPLTIIVKNVMSYYFYRYYSHTLVDRANLSEFIILKGWI